jgi:hypothetical protein
VVLAKVRSSVARAAQLPLMLGNNIININSRRYSTLLSKGNLELTYLYIHTISLIISSSYYRQEL